MLHKNEEETHVEDKPILENEKEVKKNVLLKTEETMITEEIEIEELSVDGICGVY